MLRISPMGTQQYQCTLIRVCGEAFLFWRPVSFPTFSAMWPVSSGCTGRRWTVNAATAAVVEVDIVLYVGVGSLISLACVVRGRRAGVDSGQVGIARVW